MSLPTQAEILTMDLAYKGKPFIWVATSIEVGGLVLDQAYRGRPVLTTLPVTEVRSSDTFLLFE